MTMDPTVEFLQDNPRCDFWDFWPQYIYWYQIQTTLTFENFEQKWIKIWLLTFFRMTQDLTFEISNQHYILISDPNDSRSDFWEFSTKWLKIRLLRFFKITQDVTFEIFDHTIYWYQNNSKSDFWVCFQHLRSFILEKIKQVCVFVLCVYDWVGEWVCAWVCVRGCVCVTCHVHKYKSSWCVDSCCVFVGQVGVCVCVYFRVGRCVGVPYTPIWIKWVCIFVFVGQTGVYMCACGWVGGYVWCTHKDKPRGCVYLCFVSVGQAGVHVCVCVRECAGVSGTCANINQAGVCMWHIHEYRSRSCEHVRLCVSVCWWVWVCCYIYTYIYIFIYTCIYICYAYLFINMQPFLSFIHF